MRETQAPLSTPAKKNHRLNRKRASADIYFTVETSRTPDGICMKLYLADASFIRESFINTLPGGGIRIGGASRAYTSKK